MNREFKVYPIGVVHKTADDLARIELDPKYAAGLIGLEGFSHIHVFYWFDKNDNAEQRRVLQVRPRKNPANPMTGVFAAHAPVRPNLIAHTICQCKAIEGTTLHLEGIDALDGTPVIDIKGYFPDKIDPGQVRYPDWDQKDEEKPTPEK
jgi:tRNA-Thr(GGU) m(6)t(6)A37 methyltransferase TsaA